MEMIGKAAAVAVAEETSAERGEHQPDEGRRDEGGVLRQGREAALQGDAEHRAGEINVKTVEEHADADQKHDAAVGWFERQPIEAGARIYRCHIISSICS